MQFILEILLAEPDKYMGNTTIRVFLGHVHAIKNFDEEAAIVNIQNNYEGTNSGSGTIGNNLNYYHCHFNPIDKWVEAMEEKKAIGGLIKK